MSQHDYVIRLRHMLDFAREALAITQGKTPADLSTDRLLDLALLHLVTLIGEAASRVPKDLHDKYSDIEWASIISMRNRIVHGYDTVDYDILWETISQDLPRLIASLEKIVPPDETT
jgi:uncharacterized protein with HEPN domain